MVNATMTTEQRVNDMIERHKVTRIHIGFNGVWSAECKNGGHMSSYEKLDYHTGCRAFLQGLWHEGVPFTVHGEIGKEFAEPAQ